MTSVFDSLARLFRDPPPQHVFEVSSRCIAYARPDAPEAVEYREYAPGTVRVSPLKDNVVDPEAFARAIDSLAAALPPAKKPRPAALILPDYAARLQLLDFDTFPSHAGEQQALVRFRMKKTIAFDVESAAISFYQQPSGTKKVEVVAALMSLEITGRYESPFRACGFHPGLVTTSTMAAMNLIPATGLNVLAKLSPGALSIVVTDGTSIRLTRCVELESESDEEIASLIQPTMVIVEDELRRRPDQLLLCGFGAAAARLAAQWRLEFGIAVSVLQSPFGTPAAVNAGLLGYLQGAK